MFNLSRLLAFLILLAVAALGTVVWQQLQQPQPEKILGMLPDEIDLALENLHYTQNEEGRKRWTLDADKAEYQRDSSQVTLSKVKLSFFQAGQFGNIELTADQGLLEQVTRQVDVWGDVVLTSDNGEQLFTERLHYDDQTRRLSTEEPIRFLSPQSELTGTGLQIDIDQGRLLVKDNVWVLLHPQGRENDN